MVSQVFETHLAGVEGSGLFGISDPEANVVESVEDSDRGLKKGISKGEFVNLLFQWVLRNLPSVMLRLGLSLL